jgi:hypothetical protein
MKTIYKYPLGFNEGVAETKLSLPSGFVVRQFAMQNGEPTFWAEVDTEARKSAAIFRILGTGHPIPENGHYIATCFDGPFVWHLFQLVG